MPENIQVTNILRAEPTSKELTNPSFREFRVSKQLVPQQEGRVETRALLVYKLRDGWEEIIEEYNLPPLTVGILNRLSNPPKPLPIELIFVKKEAIGIELSKPALWNDNLENHIRSIIERKE